MTLRTIFRSVILCTILSIALLCSVSVFADQESFPFRAKVVGDKVNVRAGQSANFERLCQLDEGFEVIVLEKGYGWYKIQLPSSAKSFVHKKYVQYLGQNAGGIMADRVNIRAGAGIHHTVLGQLMKGEQIFIREDLEEWYRIQPAVNSYGWVVEKFLVYKSDDVSEYTAAVAEKVIVDLEALQAVDGAQEEAAMAVEALEAKVPEVSAEAVESKASQKAAKIKKVAEEEMDVFYGVGYAEAYEGNEDGIHYKITAGGRPVCYVQGQNHLLGRFKNLRVAVEGTVNHKLRSKYSYPVVIVSKVRLML